MIFEEIVENNKLIAEFLELRTQTVKGLPGCFYYNPFNCYVSYIPEFNLSFHENWEWLMYVVEKIESLSYKKTRHFYLFKTSSYVEIKVDRMKVNLFSKWGVTTSTREAVYKAVVEFIKWYNQNNTND